MAERVTEKELLDRISELEQENDRMQVALNNKNVRDKKIALQDIIGETIYDNDDGFYDDRIDSAAEDYIRAQDDKLRNEDPDRYEEMRQMGMLG